MKLLVSLRLELIKIFRQRGTYVAYLLLAVIVGLTAWGLHRHGLPQEHRLEHLGGSDMVVGGNLVTAFALARYLMEPLFVVLVPLLVAMIAGGLIAGEGRSGVLRTWLCRPVSRFALFTSKQLAGWLYACSVTFFLALFALLVGYIIFGGGDLVSFGEGGLVIFDEGLAWQRLALAYGVAAFVMCGIASLALLASTLFENPLVAAGATIALIPMSAILQALEYFDFIEPYLITQHLDLWRHAFAAHPQWADFQQGVFVVLGYCLIPYLIGLVIFWRRDVTS